MYLICIVVAVLVQSAVAQGANTKLPLAYPGQVLQVVSSQTCPSERQQERVRNEVDSVALRLLRETILPHLQNFSCGGSTGWRRVAYLDMSDSAQRCPSVWQEITTPHRVCGRRSSSASCEGLTYSSGSEQYDQVCGRRSSSASCEGLTYSSGSEQYDQVCGRRSSSASCEGLTYSSGSEQYDQVCGRIIGYQLGSPDAFRGSWLSINTSYVDGISVTHGFPRQHIWTFAAGVHEHMLYNWSTCPCVAGSTNEIRNYIPSFVGQNYFCETGLTQWNTTDGIFWPDGDPLWDGQGCGPTSSCCTFNSPPWFNVQLPSPTTDYIEVRICNIKGIGRDDTPIEFMELYVK